SVVWYQREADGSWTSWAWEGYDLPDAIVHARTQLNDNTIYNDDPILSVEAQGAAPGHEPRQLVNGLFIDDPLQTVVQTCSTPAAFVTALVEAGWAAAPELSPLAVSDAVVCGETDPLSPDQALLKELAFKTEMTLHGVSSVNLQCFP